MELLLQVLLLTLVATSALHQPKNTPCCVVGDPAGQHGRWGSGQMRLPST